MSGENSIIKDNVQRIINERLSKLTTEDISSLFQEVNNSGTSVARIKEIISEITGCIGYQLFPIGQHHFYRARYWGDQKE